MFSAFSQTIAKWHGFLSNNQKHWEPFLKNAATRQLAKRKNWKKQTPGIQRHRKWSIIHRSKRGGPSASAVEDRPGHFHVVIFEEKRIKHNVIDDRKHAGSEHPSIKRQKGETLLNGSMIWRNERRRKKMLAFMRIFLCKRIKRKEVFTFCYV